MIKKTHSNDHLYVLFFRFFLNIFLPAEERVKKRKKKDGKKAIKGKKKP